MQFRTLTFVFMFLCCAIGNSHTARGGTGRVELRADSTVTAGSVFVVSVFLVDTVNIIGGFDLQIEFDYGALVFDSAVLGSHTKGNWEYFMARSALLKPEDSASTAGFIRLLAIADEQDAANKHPDPLSLVGPGEIARLYLYASERKEYSGTSTDLKFLWNKCSDNSFSDPSGNRLLLADIVFDGGGKRVSVDRYSGPAMKCFSTGYNAPRRAFTFANLTMKIL